MPKADNQLQLNFGVLITYIAQWEVIHGGQGLQNWTGGTWNIIKLIGMNSRFTLIPKKAQELNNFENFEIKKSNFSPALNLETS